MTDRTLDHDPPAVTTLRIVAYQLLAGRTVVRVFESVLRDLLIVVVDSDVVQKTAPLLQQFPAVEQISVGLLQAIELKLPARVQDE